MAINIYGGSISGNGIGINAPENAEITTHQTVMDNNRVAINIYSTKQQFIEESFEHGVSEEDLSAAAGELKTSQSSEYPTILSKYGIDKWLKAAADVTTIANNLMIFF